MLARENHIVGKGTYSSSSCWCVTRPFIKDPCRLTSSLLTNPQAPSSVAQSHLAQEKQRMEEKKEEVKKLNLKDGENMLAKPINQKKVEKEPLHIKVPPPKVIKAKREMGKMRSPYDPEYKTLELDISEWESAKILKRSEISPEDLKKEYKVGDNTQLD
ncbi:hypothetical protein KIN20_022070 [Parelaphostrongylus tenuis]|uniref:Uncharacterized protein n=1 Tax=Parelaphostrongylus tenuis TaxID=148309 RepID=A0AAD5QUJ0_PARTN|nr:hypothetical protein KIN20_022070 [Parelaphostrongylus tenuis]